MPVERARFAALLHEYAFARCARVSSSCQLVGIRSRASLTRQPSSRGATRARATRARTTHVANRDDRSSHRARGHSARADFFHVAREKIPSCAQPEKKRALRRVCRHLPALIAPKERSGWARIENSQVTAYASRTCLRFRVPQGVMTLAASTTRVVGLWQHAADNVGDNGHPDGPFGRGRCPARESRR
jgi:hypothetical protein